MLTVALAKGRILNETKALFQKCGCNMDFVRGKSRRLFFVDPDQGLKFILAKPVDVPTYVEYGVADLGVAGKDVLMEQRGDYYELLDLEIGKCRISLAVAESERRWPVSVATKYPRIAEEFFYRRGKQVEIIRLNGSVELAPLLGLAAGIVDLVSTGTTLKENRLVELETVAQISARLIANHSSYQVKDSELFALIDRMENVLKGD